MRRRAPMVALLSLAAGAFGLAACGSGGSADLANGKQKFTTVCGSCHALADANTKGLASLKRPDGVYIPVPNLDDAFRGSRDQGFRRSEFQGVVDTWIGDPQPPMPAGLVKGKDARDVAAYVASVAGTGKGAQSPVRPVDPNAAK